MLMQTERELIVEYGIKMSEAGLCPGTSGNLSILDRSSGLMAISPSGIDYYDTKPEDAVIMDLSGRIIDGCRKPSSEASLHAGFYKHKKDICSVVHTHSIFCTAFAVLDMPLKAVHFIIGSAGVPEVPCAPYELFGSEELAATAVRYCAESKAVLLANHGIVCCGTDMHSAYSLAENMEYAAKLQYLSMSIGSPQLIHDSEMSKVLKRLKSYGQPAADRS